MTKVIKNKYIRSKKILLVLFLVCIGFIIEKVHLSRIIMKTIGSTAAKADTGGDACSTDFCADHCTECPGSGCGNGACASS
jgi:hypothetical protein